jgi:hypothetical protein
LIPYYGNKSLTLFCVSRRKNPASAEFDEEKAGGFNIFLRTGAGWIAQRQWQAVEENSTKSGSFPLDKEPV